MLTGRVPLTTASKPPSEIGNDAPEWLALIHRMLAYDTMTPAGWGGGGEMLAMTQAEASARRSRWLGRALLSGCGAQGKRAWAGGWIGG
jgi:hypothetical protein